MSTTNRSSREVRRSHVSDNWPVRRSEDCDVNRPLPPLPLQVDITRRPSQRGEPISIPSGRRPRRKRPHTADTSSSTSSTSSRLGFLNLPPISPATSISAPSSPTMTSSPSSPKPRRNRLSSLLPSPSSASSSTPAAAPRPRPQISQPLAAPGLSSELEERYGPLNFCALAQVLRSPGFGKEGQRESWGVVPKDLDRRE
ncbi:hypothetical protein JCM11251_004411 [Rhodosporidiobolus azoricus]